MRKSNFQSKGKKEKKALSKFYPLPRETSEILNRGEKISNFGLAFHRLPYVTTKEEKLELWVKLKKDSTEIFSNLRDLIKEINARTEFILNLHKNLGFQAVGKVFASINWRMAIGLGTASPLGTGLVLHRIYGIPYIPSSAVKGIVRSYVLLDIASKLGIKAEDSQEKKPTPWEKLELYLLDTEKGLENLKKDAKIGQNVETILKEMENEVKLFRSVFGTFKSKGQVVFLDAFPSKRIDLEIDIMNPHYGPYYTGEEPPADYFSPVPIYFLTVKRGTEFTFRIAAKNQGLLDKTINCLGVALKEFGIGAKTRLGYGEMTITS
jgi:CRISPR-associated protein Cmr6